MADYTEIQNENLEPGAPWISSTAFALRDNPAAIAEGAAGAPRVVNAALSGDITDDKLSTTVTTAGRDWVLNRTAIASVGAVGTYGFFRRGAGDNVSQGTAVSGSSLRYSSTDNSAGTSEDMPSGTWRAMGAIRNSDASNEYATVFLRIS